MGGIVFFSKNADNIFSNQKCEYKDSRFTNPMHGTRRVCVRTGPGANDVVKYGLTSNTSASKYCGFKMRMPNGSIAMLGMYSTYASSSSRSTSVTSSRTSQYSTTNQTTCTSSRTSQYNTTNKITGKNSSSTSTTYTRVTATTYYETKVVSHSADGQGGGAGTHTEGYVRTQTGIAVSGTGGVVTYSTSASVTSTASRTSQYNTTTSVSNTASRTSQYNTSSSSSAKNTLTSNNINL